MTEPVKYRKKPVVVDARQITSPSDLLGVSGIAAWCSGYAAIEDPGPIYLIIPTPEGNMRANIGDWVIRGVAGEFCPCKPDIFEATYEPYEEETR